MGPQTVALPITFSPPRYMKPPYCRVCDVAHWPGDPHMGQVLTQLEINPEDWVEFIACRERIRGLLAKRLNPEFGFVHTKKNPGLSWEGCEIVEAK